MPTTVKPKALGQHSTRDVSEARKAGKPRLVLMGDTDDEYIDPKRRTH